MDELDLLKTKARLVGVYAHHRLELSQSMCGHVSLRVLIKNQLHSYSQHRVVVLLSEEVWRSHYKFRLPGEMLTHLWSHNGWGMGVGEDGVVKTVAVCNCTLFCFFWRIELLILLSGCAQASC